MRFTNKIITFFLLLLAIDLLSYEYPPTLYTTDFTSPSFKGLILVDKEENLNPQGYQDIQGIFLYHVPLPGKIETLKNKLHSLFKRTLSKETIIEIKKCLLRFYQANGRPIISIFVPQQDISHGVLQLVVTEGKLGKVRCQGNKWFSSDNLEKSIQIKPGQVLASEILNQNLYWINRNPFRHVDLIYTPGEEKETTDIELLVTDRFPLRSYLGIDNTGNDITGNNRLFAGLNWGKVFWSDHRLAYQFSTSPDFDRYWAHTLFYEAPLPWHHLLLIYGGYSHVDADFHVPNIKGTKFRTHGFGVQASLRYDIPIKASNFLHEFSWGFDFKRTNNNLDFGGRPIISKDNVNLSQLMISYNLGYDIPTLTLSFEIEGFWSPGQWLPDQSNKDYEALRPYAKNQYIYTRSALTLIWHYYKEWTMHNYLRGQIANINLLPSEQYGLGGYNTIRGYKERIVNGDNAFIWNLEMRTPNFSILNFTARGKKFKDACQFLLFFDFGWEGVKQAVKKQNKTETLYSIGPGIRYNINPYLRSLHRKTKKKD